MATSNTNVWVNGFSGNPAGEALRAKSIIEMLDLVGDELVGAPPTGTSPGIPVDVPNALLMTRREILARVLWTRATLDADNAAAKLIIEYLDGKPGEAEAAPAEAPALTADDLALAEALLREGNAS